MLRARLAIKVDDFKAANKILSAHICLHRDCFLAYELRSLCSLHCDNFQQALNDALQCTRLQPGSSKGWARLGAAQLFNDHIVASISAYRRGLSIDRNDEELKIGLQLAKEAMAGNPIDRKAMLHVQ